MKKTIFSLIAIFALVGCGSGNDTTTIPPADITVITEAPIITIEMPEVETPVIPEVPEGAEELFQGVSVSYDVGLGCKGGTIGVTLTFKSNDKIDPYAFIVDHKENGMTVEFSEPNVVDAGAITMVKDIIYIDATDERVRHNLSIDYYGDEITRLSSHYTDQEPCVIEEVIEEIINEEDNETK